jgi:hypothetical protein
MTPDSLLCTGCCMCNFSQGRMVAKYLPSCRVDFAGYLGASGHCASIGAYKWLVLPTCLIPGVRLYESFSYQEHGNERQKAY